MSLEYTIFILHILPNILFKQPWKTEWQSDSHINGKREELKETVPN